MEPLKTIIDDVILHGICVMISNEAILDPLSFVLWISPKLKESAKPWTESSENYQKNTNTSLRLKVTVR